MTEEFTVDWPHGHTMSNGIPVRVICKDGKGSYPIVAMVPNRVSGEFPKSYTLEGCAESRLSSENLINKPAPNRRIKGQLVMNKGVIIFIDDGDPRAPGAWETLARIDIEEGEGL